jgi:hypothetical protein
MELDLLVGPNVFIQMREAISVRSC